MRQTAHCAGLSIRKGLEPAVDHTVIIVSSTIFKNGSIFCKYFCTDIPKGTVNMAYWASAYVVFPLLNLLRCLVKKKKRNPL